MGDTLSTPNKEKHTETGEDERFRFASCGMQGWRRGMEDSHTTVLSMPSRPSDAFFAVFDGHCGPPVAQFCGERVYRILGDLDEYKRGDLEAALTRSFLKADELIKEDDDLHDTRAGTTAVAVLVTGEGKILCANAGDSRAVLCRSGRALDLSIDHKPFLDTERARIEAAGGFVMLGRVNGNLALSRAIGDFEFKGNQELGVKDQAVTADPEIRTEELKPEDRYMIVACDGIWDVKSSQEVCDFISSKMDAGVPLDKICEDLCDDCIASEPGGLGCDNMTVVIVEFKANAKK